MMTTRPKKARLEPPPAKKIVPPPKKNSVVVEKSCLRKNILSQREERSKHTVEDFASEFTSLSSIFRLQKDGLWCSKQVAKQIEPPRNKCHWDFMLEEMEWMSNDFRLERKWKLDAAKKISRAVLKYFRDLELKDNREAKREETALRKTASSIAKEVKKFWGQVDKVKSHLVEMKVEAEKKKRLEERLNVIVGETEKFAQDLTFELQQPSPVRQDSSKPSSSSSSSSSSLLNSSSILEDSMDFDGDETMTIGEDKEAKGKGLVDGDGKEIISKYAEVASSAQPTGFTLETTKVKTKVPFLLKHTLREYQHIGLDWLVAMHDKGLNGIMADEMGLGMFFFSYFYFYVIYLFIYS